MPAMPFVFLLVFALVSFQAYWPAGPEALGIIGSALAPWLLAIAFGLLAAWQTRRFCTRLAAEPGAQGPLWRQFQRSKRRLLFLLTASYLGALFGLGWGLAAEQGAAELGVAALTELIQFAPLLLALVLAWSAFYRAERAISVFAPDGDEFMSRGAYLRYQVRHNLLLVVPPVVLSLTMKGFFLAFPGVEDYDLALAVAGLALLAGSIASVPLILRIFLGLRPLPPGPLRDRLVATARRLHFRFSDVLVWDTRCTVANAMVSGTVPWLRYVVLTDLLIEKLTPDEIEAVFGHEVGHIKHHHMTLYILFFVGSIALLTGLWKCGERVLELAGLNAAGGAWSGLVGGPALLAVVSAYVVVVFGFLSRRCERQADLFGCAAVSSGAFIGALEKVADLNGIPRQRAGWLTSWQHPSIAERVAFVERLRDDPALEPRFQQSLLRLKLGLMTGLTVSLALVVGLVAWQFGAEHVWDLLRMR